MKRYVGLYLMVALLAVVQPVAAADIQIMTQNQYLGADLTPLFTTKTPEEFNAAAVAALQQVAANQPAERVKALAREILWNWPALVGLQEVYLFNCTDLIYPPPTGAGCDDPSIRGAFVDHLPGTLQALHGIYYAAASVTNLNLSPGIPILINAVPILVQVVDRDVILARRDVHAEPVDFTEICPKLSGDGCNFTFVLEVPTPLGVTIPVERGFVAVDATVYGQAYRFVTTHLEQKYADPSLNVLQELQAYELISILKPAPEDRILLLVGDMNSSPVDLGVSPLGTPYNQFRWAGFTDAWTLRRRGSPGFTCCQDADLSNLKSKLYERVDMLYSLDAPAKVENARVVGATVLEKTPPFWKGLWPSDHAAVTAELEFR